MAVTLLLGTRKGGFILRSDARRQTWKLTGPIHLGEIVHHMALDPRDGRTMLMAARAGHLGPTVFRSTDGGETWAEADQPPAFPKASEGQKGRFVHHVFTVVPGHPSRPGVWYAGSSPQGLFRSEDGGATWHSVAGFNDHPMYRTWAGAEEDSPPDGATLHSITIDPRDARHMYIGMSGGGVFETTDGGESDWQPLNKGSVADFLPTPDPEYGQDVHHLCLHPLMPDRLYQQNHCGIYRMERAEGVWLRIGDNMPRDIGDIGFPIVLHPRDADTAYVFPMDGTTVWPRTSPGGRPAVYVTRDAGGTWQRLDRGLPPEQAWFTVKRLSMAADQQTPLGIYFGTTNGEVWGSSDEGETWRSLVSHLPEIYSLEAAESAP